MPRHNKIPVMHGCSNTKEYRVWAGIIKRCYNKNCPDYKDYGERGITTSEEWKNFVNFYNDMGKRPLNHSIERLDNNKGYFKENCVWANDFQQARNKRSNVNITFYNITMILADWEKLTGICYKTIQNRIFKSGWPVSLALTLPGGIDNRKENKRIVNISLNK
jgi:hypothetical protein